MAKNPGIEKAAMQYAEKECARITAKHFSAYQPLSVFMAGSPGAGKTETAKRIARDFAETNSGGIWHIDPDNFRAEFPDYSDKTADSYQEAIRYLAEFAMLNALELRRDFIMDGTFSDIVRQRRHVGWSVKAKRRAVIVYVHQSPQIAWKLVRSRRAAEGRSVPPEVFVRSYLGAYKTASAIKAEFGGAVQLNLVVKDNNNPEKDKFRVENIASLDKYLGIEYNEDMLRKIVSEDQ